MVSSSVRLILAAGAISTTRSRTFINEVGAAFDDHIRRYGVARKAENADARYSARMAAAALVETAEVAVDSLVREHGKTNAEAFRMVREALGERMARIADPDAAFALNKAVRTAQPKLIERRARRVLNTHAAIMAP